jgi:hypothetical protein
MGLSCDGRWEGSWARFHGSRAESVQHGVQADRADRARAGGESPTSATGTEWEPMPWHASQRAAWEALTKAGVEARPRP